MQGLASMVRRIAEELEESEAVLCLVASIACQAAVNKRNFAFFGGTTALAKLLVSLLQRALAHCDPCGRGAWLRLLDVASRGLAQLASSQAGRLALAELGSAAALLSVLRVELRVCFVRLAGGWTATWSSAWVCC